MTEELAKSIVKNSTRCTQATLKAFGIEDAIPYYSHGCLQHLEKAGYSCKLLPYEIPIKKFTFDPTKKYLIVTRGHAMAYINGILIDTEVKGLDGRKIQFIWEVFK